MSTRCLLYTLMVALVLQGCVGTDQPFAGTLPSGSAVNMAGTFSLSPSGELLLKLDEPCMMRANSEGGASSMKRLCDASRRDEIAVVAVTPWSEKIRGTWINATLIKFSVDWKQSDLDPLASDAVTVAGRPWEVSGTQWMPTADDVRKILLLVSDPSDTAELRHDGEAPNLEVVGFEVVGGTLHAGLEGTLMVRIANRGPGTAYRVVATMRSSVHALHGQRLVFGVIKPGLQIVRQLRVSVPATETASDAMLVAVVTEGNGFAPPNASRRVPIAMAKPTLSVQCSAGGSAAARVEVDAGQTITLHCVVENTGTLGAKVELETSLAGALPLRFAARDVAVSAHVPIDVPIVIPADLPIGATAKLSVTAQDRQFARSAPTAVNFVIRKPKLCVLGQLTDAQYHAKIKDLRAELSAGHLTQAQFDRYDAEYVTCLK